MPRTRPAPAPAPGRGDHPLLAAVLIGAVLLLAVSCTEPKAGAHTTEPRNGTEPAPPANATATRTKEGSAAGVSHPVVSFAGLERSYRLYVPPSARDAMAHGDRVPLLLSFHAVLDNEDDVSAFDQTESLADREGLVVAHPAGLPSGREGSAWNAGGCCAAPHDSGADDVGFTRAVIDDISAHSSIDPARVYAIGYSNGGMLAYRLACELSDRIAAAGSVAGTFETRQCTPARPVPFLHVHGRNDPVVPFDGGPGDISPTLNDYEFHSVQSSIDAMRRADGCAADGKTTTDADITTTDWACRDHTVVRLVAIARSGHLWPMGYRLETPYGNDGGYDAAAEFWRFFRDHPLR